ncbi:MAG TPA: Gfo/Idh/MocA family oxidoreductase, partial [Chloroflexota bacterium]
MDSVRIAMLGGGFVANFYMQGLQDVGGHEVVVVVSQREDTAKSLAQRWHIPETSDSFDLTIARDDIDLYLIALPNFLHRDIAVALARAGRNQVCT